MMSGLVARGARLAAQRQRQRIDRIAGELRAMFGDSAVAIDGAAVLVRGKDLTKRWLVDPSLRFLGRLAR